MNNWQYRILAVLLAIACWYVVTGREKVDAWIEIPVELTNTPRDLYISKGLTTRVDVRVRGPKSMVRGLDPKDLAYSLDLSNLSPGDNSLPFKPEKVPVSSALDVMEINPPRINLVVDKLVEKSIRVEPRWEASLNPDYEFKRATVRPTSTRISGPENIVSMLDSVPTETINVNATKPDTIRTEAGLILDESIEADPSEVDVTLVFGIKRQEIWLKIPVSVNAPEGVSATPRPETVQLKVNTPVSFLPDEELKKKVFVEVRLDEGVKQINDVFPYHVELPKEVSLLKSVPEQVEIIFGNRK